MKPIRTYGNPAILLILGILLWLNALEAKAVLLTYNTNYVIKSSTQFQTGNTTLTDDPQAKQTFTLTADQTVLVIYSAHNAYGSTSQTTGERIGISVDGTDRGMTWNTPAGGNYANGATTFWIGVMAAGSHTVAGRLASSYGATVSIDERVLLIHVFNGNEFSYTDSATSQSTASTTFTDDSSASSTIMPSESCKALILYNTGADVNSDIDMGGKKIAINVGGSDYAQAEKASAVNAPNNVFTLHYANLPASASTIKGRFAATLGTVVISRRQFGVLLFNDASTAANYINGGNPVSTTSAYGNDDTEATISYSPAGNANLLVIAMGTKRNGTSSSTYGEAYGIAIDGIDCAKSRTCPEGPTYANSASTAWSTNVVAGAHTVQGRFGNNTGSVTATIDSRQVVALWFGLQNAASSGTVFLIK